MLVREQMLGYPQLQEAEARFSRQTHATGRFGDFLVSQGYITPDQLTEALRAQESTCPPLLEVLCQLGFTTPDVVQAAARELAGNTASAAQPEPPENTVA